MQHFSHNEIACYVLSITQKEALAFAISILRQVEEDNCNASRIERMTENGEYFTMAIAPKEVNIVRTEVLNDNMDDSSRVQKLREAIELSLPVIHWFADTDEKCSCDTDVGWTCQRCALLQADWRLKTVLEVTKDETH